MKILLVRLSSLGDLVYVTSILEALHHHGHEIHLLTDQTFADLFLGDPRLRRLWQIDRKALRQTLPAVLSSLQEEAFDFAVDLHKKPVTQWVVRRAQAKRVLSIQKRSLRRRLRVWFRCPMRPWHIVEWYAEPLIHAGLMTGPLPQPSIQTPPLSDLPFSLPPHFLVLAPEASHPAKEWPHFRALAETLHRTWSTPVVVVGTHPDPPGYPGIDLRGKTNLRQLVEIIRRSEGVIANDSGPAHLAAAAGKPLIVFFGPTVPDMGFRPWGNPWLRIFERPYGCRPCSLHGSRFCRFSFPSRCLADISPEEVLHVLQSLRAFTIRGPDPERRQEKP